MMNIIFIAVFVVVLIIIFSILYKNLMQSNAPQEEDVKLEDYNPNTIINRATNLHESGQINKAIKLLEESTKRFSDDIKIRFLLGEYLLEKNQAPAAQKQFKHILKLSPSNKKAAERSADCYAVEGKFDKALEGYFPLAKAATDDHELLAKMANCYTKLGKYEQAIREYRIILSKDAYNTRVKECLGDLFLITDDFSRAIREYEDVIKTEGLKIDLLKKIAKAHEKAGNFVDASMAYKRILDKDESAEFAYKELAGIYVKLQKYDKAAKVYTQMLEKGIAVQPALLLKLAETYILAEEADKAVALCGKILTEKPDYLPAVAVLAEAHRGSGNHEEALNYYKKLTGENTNAQQMEEYRKIMCEILCEWGEKLYDKQDYQSALDRFIEALQHDLKNSKIYLNLGKTNQAIKNYEAAFSHFQKALQLSDSDPAILLLVGKAYQEAGQDKAAIDLYYDAARKYPQNWEIKMCLGISMGKAGFYPQALEELNKALEMNPSSPEIFHNLGLVFEARDDNEKANDYYRRALAIDPGYNKAKESIIALKEKEKGQQLNQTDEQAEVLTGEPANEELQEEQTEPEISSDITDEQ